MYIYIYRYIPTIQLMIEKVIFHAVIMWARVQLLLILMTTMLKCASLFTAYCLFIVCFFSQTRLVSVSISSLLSISTIDTARVDMGCAAHEKNTPLPTPAFQGSMILSICNYSWNKSAQAPPCHQWPRFPRNENRHDVLRFRPKNRCFEWCLWLTCWPWCHLFAHVMNVSWCIMGPTCSKPIPLFYPFMKSPIPRWL